MFFKKQSESEFLSEFENHLNTLENFDEEIIQNKKQAAVAYLLTAASIMEDIQSEIALDLNNETAIVTALISKGTEAELSPDTMQKLFATITDTEEKIVKEACCCKH